MKIKKYNKDKIWFTSDTHFNHSKIIDFCHRPFVNVDDMNNKLIENWNSVVQPDDDIFHLGDFSYGNIGMWEQILKKLNGRIHLIIGNHDMRQNITSSGLSRYFTEYCFQQNIKVDGKVIVMNHYPFLCYGRYNDPNYWQLYGHVHSGPNATGTDLPRLVNCFPTQYDIGVDNNNYFPVSYEQVKEKIEERLNSVKQ